MSRLQPVQESGVVESVFTADERAVIEFWLEHPDTPPAAGDAIERVLSEWGIEGQLSYTAKRFAAAGVARIALAVVEDRLPQFALCSDDSIQLGRHVRPASERYERDVVLRPRFLFSLDWAATAPGVSWPRDYYATWFPGYGIWVVTVSFDTTDTWGLLDVAVGWFDDRQAFDEGVRDTIMAHWRRDEWLEPGGEWEYFWAEGAVSAGEALAWRALVWPSTAIVDAEEDEVVDEENAAES